MRTQACAFALVAGMAFTGCPQRTADDDTTTPEEDYVGRDARVLAETLQFTDATDQARFEAARACFAGRHEAGVAAGQEWRHYPLREIGNFIEEDWCRGVHSRGCSGGTFKSERGDEWYQVSTLHYDSRFPEVFGIGVEAGQLPRDGDWGVSFSYWARGEGIVGDGVRVTFHRFEGTEIVESVSLGDFYRAEIEETSVSVVAPGTQDAVLARLVRSPASLQAEAAGRYGELLALVGQHLDAGLARKCVYGPYEGDGIPPECTRTPLTPQEQDAARAAAEAKLGGQIAAVEQNAERFHRLLTELMVFDRCWGTPLAHEPSLRPATPRDDVPGAGPPAPVVEIRDAADAVRATYHGAVWFWAPLDDHRLLVGASGWRALGVDEPGHGQGLGDANQQLLEITLPDEGPPTQRVLLETHRGDLGCRLSPDGTAAACVARHVKTQVLEMRLLDLTGAQVAPRYVETVEDVPVKICYTKPQLRYRDDHFEVLLHDVERRGDERWVALQEAP